MKNKTFQPDWGRLGARMKWMATIAVGTSAFLGACATSAVGEEAEKSERREIIVADSQIVVSDGDTNSRVVRMVVENDGNGDEETDICVFVTAGDDAGGALSCPGGNVRVFQFGAGHGRQFVVGDEVVDEDEIRRLVEARVAEANARLADRGAWEVEVVERFNSQEFQQEMRELEREMQELQRVMRVEFRDRADMSAEERAEFEEAMRDLGEEMAELQTETMAELAQDLAELAEMSIHVSTMSAVPHTDQGMHWFGEESHMGRQIIRVDRDGEEHLTIIERLQDDDGKPRIVIHTTDPDSVEVIGINPEDIND